MDPQITISSEEDGGKSIKFNISILNDVILGVGRY
jgi:hypothetical protein